MPRIQGGIVFWFCAFFQAITLAQVRQSVNEVRIVEAFPNLRFVHPVLLTHSNDGSNRIFIVEQSGKIKVFPNDPSASAATDFLNIESRVNDEESEMGLLGLTFDPAFSNNGYFYVNYTAGSGSQRRTVVSRFSLSTNNADQADPNSEQILLEFNQPFTNHNGGMIEFGPDGFLYIATGDGGSGGDPLNNAQNLGILLGKMLRIDVDNQTGGLAYTIPADNPFVGNNQGYREEIWAYGLRNPWRFSFDSGTGQVWAGDVGQGAWEEVDLIEKGNNYGWRIMEGFHCFNSSNCSSAGLTQPILEYDHNEGRSITGGYVYRGALRPELQGAYIYGDFSFGNIWMLRYENAVVTVDSLLLATELNISSFGVDETDELYILDYSPGVVYRFEESPATAVQEDRLAIRSESFTLDQNYPNPFNPQTRIHYTVPASSEVHLLVFDSLGRRTRQLVQATQGPGQFEVAWDGRNDHGQRAGSGVYYYRLSIDGVPALTRRMALIR